MFSLANVFRIVKTDLRIFFRKRMKKPPLSQGLTDGTTAIGFFRVLAVRPVLGQRGSRVIVYTVRLAPLAIAD